MKGKIINFSPHRRRGLIVVHVKGQEGMEYQHLQFDSKHYDASIETHLYKDQSVDVSLINIKRGVFKVEKITYDIGKNLYKRTRPESPPSDQRRPYRGDREGRSPDRGNYRNRQYSNQSSDRNRPQGSSDRNRPQRSSDRNRSQGSGDRNRPQRSSDSNRSQGSGDRNRPQRSSDRNKGEGNAQSQTKSSGKPFQRSNKSENRTQQRGDHRSPRNQKDTQFKGKSRESRKSKRGLNRNRFRERLRYLAFFLHYRRVKIQKLNKLQQFQKMRKLNYRRNNLISS